MTHASGRAAVWGLIAVVALAALAVANLWLLRRVAPPTAEQPVAPQYDPASGYLAVAERGGPFADGDRPRDRFDVESRQRELAMSILSTDRVLSFLQDPATKRLDWVVAHARDPQPLDEALAAGLSAEPVPGTTAVRVRFRGADRRQSAELVNALMRFIETQAHGQAVRNSLDQLEAIQRQLDTFRTEWNVRDDELKGLTQTPEFESPEATFSPAAERFRLLCQAQAAALVEGAPADKAKRLAAALEKAELALRDVQSRQMRYRQLSDEQRELAEKMAGLEARVLELRMGIDAGLPSCRILLRAW